MNEITKIHLGRQPFVIAVDAYKLLQAYLHDIKRQVGSDGASVMEEIESRMAELLAERGVSGDRVVLVEDVAFLKEQLGSPTDFKDDDTADEAAAHDGQAEAGAKRLFRDTDHGMLAGVSAGIANYVGIDPLIVRIIFIIATISGGWGIAIYVVLWLVMPEAKTASERLQMRGKAVTVDSLKEIVDRADVSGAAHRATRSLGIVVEMGARVLLVICGSLLAIVATALLAALATVGVYALTHNGHLLHGALVFPVGVTEVVAAAGGIAVVVALLGFMLASGVAMARRKWSLPGWGVGALLGLLLVGLISAGATVPDTIQNVRDRYQSARHTVVRTLPAFNAVNVQQGSVDIHTDYVYDGQYKVEIQYLGEADVQGIKTDVTKNTLTIDTRNFKPTPNWNCDGLCIGDANYFRIVVHEPEPTPPQPADEQPRPTPIHP